MSEENNIIHSNADEQENAPVAENAVTETSAATTKTPAQTEPIIINEPVAETLAAHDDFDWSIDKRNVSHYASDEKAKYDKVYENTFVSIEDGEIVKGTIVALTKTDAVINIGFKK